MLKQGSVLYSAEVMAERAVLASKAVMPVVARLCLLSAFLEDGWRMYDQWGDQRDYVSEAWSCGPFPATLFVLFNLAGQVGGVALVLARRRITLACALLATVVVVQTVGYSILYDAQFLLRNLAVVGGLLLLVAEARVKDRSTFAGVPSLGGDRAKASMQLAGRTLLVFMFVTLLRFQLAVVVVLQNLVGSLLIALVAIGYKTKLCSLILVTWLNVINFFFNAWWTVPAHLPLRDFLKFDFFQTLSVIGGLLMVVALGPGAASVDERKKNW